MDNGHLQQQMVEQLKKDVRERAGMRRTIGYLRQAETAAETHVPDEGNLAADAPSATEYSLPYQGSIAAAIDTPHSKRSIHGTGFRNNAPSTSAVSVVDTKVWPGCDPGFMTYYLDYFFPFLFPFYQPHMLEGGRTWLLQFMNEAEGMQQTTLALSSYLFSIVLDASEAGHEICKKIGWDKLLAEMQNTFKRLRDDIPKLSQDQADASRLSRAVRILGTIVHLERFELATQGFANCNTHLNAGIRCFEQILDSSDIGPRDTTDARFFRIIGQLGPSPWPRPYRKFQIPSSEQVAFRFFVSLLVADDIIASTSLAEEPRLYSYHKSLLAGGPDAELPVDLEAVMGCQNLAMLQIGEISALAAWTRSQGGSNKLSPDFNERYGRIKTTLENHLETFTVSHNAGTRGSFPGTGDAVLNLFHVWQCQPSTPANQSKIVTQIWSHAAMIYLLTTLHGCDPMQPAIRRHVEHTIQLFTNKLSAPALLRSVAWPFCVVGCLALPEQESIFRSQMHHLEPSGLFVTMRKALEIMEAVWIRRRLPGLKDPLDSDIASCLGATGEVLFLL